ncbi:MAG: hypoxanthine phosphoribosyltransferase [Thermodesulfobacteriota bacterium]
MADRKLIISAKDIALRVADLGKEISSDFTGKQLLVIGILNGAFIFTADLVRHITIPLEIDFIRVASYGSATESTGEIRLVKDLEIPVEGKDILLVEDIVDTGNTMEWLSEHLQGRGASSIRLCTLISKQERREKSVQIDYCGFQVQEGFLIGYGLDHAEQHRHLPDIYHLKSS